MIVYYNPRHNRIPNIAPAGVYVGTRAEAEAIVKKLRDSGATHIVIAEDPLIQVGADDVGGIVQDGKLPDGSDYTWKKRRP